MSGLKFNDHVGAGNVRLSHPGLHLNCSYLSHTRLPPADTKHKIELTIFLKIENESLLKTPEGSGKKCVIQSLPVITPSLQTVSRST